MPYQRRVANCADLPTAANEKSATTAAGLRIRPARPPDYRTPGLGHPALRIRQARPAQPLPPARWQQPRLPPCPWRPAQQHRPQRLAPDQPPVQRRPRTAAPTGPAAQPVPVRRSRPPAGPQRQPATARPAAQPLPPRLCLRRQRQPRRHRRQPQGQPALSLRPAGSPDQRTGCHTRELRPRPGRQPARPG
ncbi:hypothetical protein C4K38_0235 [Pseudomonas chlororaphis subsp. piscium]|nr:hypothetical protein C4K38_0235 [Pseudomonas chlororaphis subsp. piscium]